MCTWRNGRISDATSPTPGGAGWGLWASTKMPKKIVHLRMCNAIQVVTLLRSKTVPAWAVAPHPPRTNIEVGHLQTNLHLSRQLRCVLDVFICFCTTTWVPSIRRETKVNLALGRCSIFCKWNKNTTSLRKLTQQRHGYHQYSDRVKEYLHPGDSSYYNPFVPDRNQRNWRSKSRVYAICQNQRMNSEIHHTKLYKTGSSIVFGVWTNPDVLPAHQAYCISIPTPACYPGFRLTSKTRELYGCWDRTTSRCIAKGHFACLLFKPTSCILTMNIRNELDPNGNQIQPSINTFTVF